MKVHGIFRLFFCVTVSAAGMLPVPDHPRIIWQNGTGEIHQMISRNERFRQLQRIILNQADAMIPLEVVKREQVGRRLLGVSRTCLKRVLALSYAFRMTGNPKYLKRAETEMLAAASFSDWNPSHFLDVAEMTTALSIGYDWLYNDLKPGSRKAIETAILNKGLKPSVFDTSGNTWWLNAEHNWNQVCNAGMLLGALAIYEDEPELAGQVIKRTRESIQLPSAEYEPDGAYPEGANYWGYGTTYHLILIDAFESGLPAEDALEIGSGFLKSASFYLHIQGPTGSFNYADGYPDQELSPAVFWYAARTGDNGLLWFQKKALDRLIRHPGKLLASGSSDRFLPMVLIWGSRLDTLSFPEPESCSWLGRGNNPVALHRSSWSDSALFIGIKGGSPSVNHGHMDIGSFVMDAKGVRWAIDLGAHDYYKLEVQGIQLFDRSPGGDRWKIMRYTNLLHNTLVVNGALQKVEAFAPIIRNSGEDPRFRYTVVDLSPVYEQQLVSAVRGIALVDSRYVMIRDEILNHESLSRVRWGMVTWDSVQIQGSNAVIRKDGKSLTFQIRHPEHVNVQVYPTDPRNHFEDKNPGTVVVGFEILLEPGQKENLTVLLIPEGSSIPETIREDGLNEWSSGQIRFDHYYDEPR
jgi:hypothetical protein